MPQNTDTNERFISIAENLVNTKVTKLEGIGIGKNNKIFRLETTYDVYALKIYYTHRNDTWDRLGTEFDALSFLYSNGLTCIPKPYVENREDQCAIYEWIEGQRVHLATLNEVNIATSFLLKIQSLVSETLPSRIGNASASTFSVYQLFNHINERLDKLIMVAAKFPALEIFLNKHFIPAYKQETERVRNALSKFGMNEMSVLDPKYRALSPSDFGIHNMLRSPDGKLNFFDFEYFGWDDPVKMVSDVILHPGNLFTPKLQKHFYHRMNEYYKIPEPTFPRRFQATLPLYGLIWCLIMLGDFLPEKWERRKFAGEDEPKIYFQNRQLTKARFLLNKVITPSFSDRIISNI